MILAYIFSIWFLHTRLIKNILEPYIFLITHTDIFLLITKPRSQNIHLFNSKLILLLKYIITEMYKYIP